MNNAPSAIGGYGTDYAAASQTAKSVNAPLVPSALDEINAQIADVNQRAVSVLGRIIGLGDRAYGPVPESCSGSELCDRQDGKVPRVWASLRDLNATIAEIESALTRVEDLA